MAGELDLVGPCRINRLVLGADRPHKAKNPQRQRQRREREVKGLETWLLWSGPEDTWEKAGSYSWSGGGGGLPWVPAKEINGSSQEFKF